MAQLRAPKQTEGKYKRFWLFFASFFTPCLPLVLCENFCENYFKPLKLFFFPIAYLSRLGENVSFIIEFNGNSVN